MKALVSFHPIHLDFFETTIEPLVAGQKINPESFLEAALRLRRSAWRARLYKQSLELYREQLEPPPPLTEGTLWDKVRSRLERLDHKPDTTARLVAELVEPDLHVYGRPFLVTEGSAESVGSIVDEYVGATGDSQIDSLILEQLIRLDPGLGKNVQPKEGLDLPADMAYRSELLASLKELHDLGQAARAGQQWGRMGDEREPATEVLVRELPWRSVSLHARAFPFWIGRDVDGLETICRAAEIAPPEFLVAARRLFTRTFDELPELRQSLQVELQGPNSVGAFVSPSDIPELLAFLNDHGSRMIQVATRHGEGPTCAILLRKIRECAAYANKHGLAYLEASGVKPCELEIPEEAD